MVPFFLFPIGLSAATTSRTDSTTIEYLSSLQSAQAAYRTQSGEILISKIGRGAQGNLLLWNSFGARNEGPNEALLF
jgi:hypothetical protein